MLVYVVPAVGILLAAAGIAFAVLRWRRRGGGPGGGLAAVRWPHPTGSRLEYDMGSALRPVIVIAQESVDATVFAAFAVGFISFVSPCVLPLVPGYLSTISGVSFADIQEGKGRRQGARARPLLFCLAFSAVMFVVLHLPPPVSARPSRITAPCCRQISGVVITLLGVLFIATLFVPKLNRERRPEELMRRAHTGGPIIAGLAFAVAWLPCT